MAVKDPQQQIFGRVRKDLKSLGYAVYDGFLPPEDTPYPFIYLGDVMQTDDRNKTAVFGNVYFTIHVWHNNPQQRGTVSQMLFDIKNVCRYIERTENFCWDMRNMTQRILPDNSTKTPLLHGVIEAEFKFS